MQKAVGARTRGRRLTFGVGCAVSPGLLTPCDACRAADRDWMFHSFYLREAFDNEAAAERERHRRVRDGKCRPS